MGLFQIFLLCWHFSTKKHNFTLKMHLLNNNCRKVFKVKWPIVIKNKKTCFLRGWWQPRRRSSIFILDQQDGRVRSSGVEKNTWLGQHLLQLLNTSSRGHSTASRGCRELSLQSPRCPTWFWAPATTRPGWIPHSRQFPRTHRQGVLSGSWTLLLDSPRPKSPHADTQFGHAQTTGKLAETIQFFPSCAPCNSASRSRLREELVYPEWSTPPSHIPHTAGRTHSHLSPLSPLSPFHPVRFVWYSG